MAELASCVFDSREARSFNLRLHHSVTKNLPSDTCIEAEVPLPPGAGLMCTTRYWPNWDSGRWMKISVVVTRTHRQRHKVLAAHIDLPGRTGLPVPACFMDIKREPILATSGDDCEGGLSLLVSRDSVERYCVVDGHFTALCTVAVSRAWPPPPPPPPLPTPAALGCAVSMAPDLVDVSFQVEGETFDAHRLVLAARSPVFKAELFGQMAESKARSITIQDMRASTFVSMLDYMYHGLLPAAATPEMDNAAMKMEFQHLYAAAARYGLDTLKEMCEEVLYTSVSVSTVLSNLVFAEERTCRKLKLRCLEFLGVAENFMEVAVTNEYVEIMKDTPSLLAEVQNRLKRPRLYRED